MNNQFALLYKFHFSLTQARIQIAFDGGQKILCIQIITGFYIFAMH